MASANDRIRSLEEKLRELREGENPVRNFRFSVDMIDRAGEHSRLSIMSVEGLRSPGPGILRLTSGIPAGRQSDLSKWYMLGHARTLHIHVLPVPVSGSWDSVMRFQVYGVNPVALKWGHLDAGANELLLETLEARYEDLDVFRHEAPAGQLLEK